MRSRRLPVSPGGNWAGLLFSDRWLEVEAEMRELKREGLTTSISELDEIANAAYALASTNGHSG
jgi:hypothetical protein